MFHADKQIDVPLKASPSLTFNNLTSNGSSFAYAHLSEVWLLNESSMDASPPAPSHTKVAYKDPAHVLHVRFVKTRNSEFLVLGTETGVQIFDSHGQRLIFNHSLQTASDKPRYARGSATGTAGSKDYIAVGTSVNDVLVFSVDKENFSLAHTLKGHKYPLVDLAGQSPVGELIASADEEGTIHVWKLSDFSKHSTYLGSSYPCTSIVFAGSSIVASYITGQIVIYDLNQRRKFAQIGAHSRAINALAVHPSQALVASAGEDQFVNVWSISVDPPEIKLAFSVRCPNWLLTGIQFAGQSRPCLSTIAYDAESLRAWPVQ